MAIASLRSILTLKPPLTHCCAAPLPENSPRCTSDLPTIAAVTAPIPIMNGVAMLKSLGFLRIRFRITERYWSSKFGASRDFRKFARACQITTMSGNQKAPEAKISRGKRKQQAVLETKAKVGHTKEKITRIELKKIYFHCLHNVVRKNYTQKWMWPNRRAFCIPPVMGKLLFFEVRYVLHD